MRPPIISEQPFKLARKGDPLSESAADRWLPAAAKAVFLNAGNAARQELRQDQHAVQLSQLVQHAHQMTDSIILQVVQMEPDARRPVCCEGCAACCHLHVVATPVEVLGIAEYLLEHLTPAQITEVLSRIERHIEQTDGMDAAARRQIRLACPLLESGRCMVYSVRPISCRGWNSLDRSVCDADLANPAANASAPVNLRQYVLAGRIAEGLSAASHSLGLEARPLDLVRGLQIALNDFQATIKEWRSGTDVFEEAVNEQVFQAPRELEQEQARNELWNSL